MNVACGQVYLFLLFEHLTDGNGSIIDIAKWNSIEYSCGFLIAMIGLRFTFYVTITITISFYHQTFFKTNRMTFFITMIIHAIHIHNLLLIECLIFLNQYKYLNNYL